MERGRSQGLETQMQAKRCMEPRAFGFSNALKTRTNEKSRCSILTSFHLFGFPKYETRTSGILRPKIGNNDACSVFTPLVPFPNFPEPEQASFLGTLLIENATCSVFASSKTEQVAFYRRIERRLSVCYGRRQRIALDEVTC